MNGSEYNDAATRHLTDAEQLARQTPDARIASPLDGDHVLGLIINPRSRRNTIRFNQIIQIASKSRKCHHFVTDQPGQVSEALADLAGRSVDVLAISGGDGTVSRVLTHLLEENHFDRIPLIAILPGGTANMIAGDIGLRGSTDAALRRLCDWVGRRSGRAQLLRRPVLRVQPGMGRPASYGMFFGAGAIVQGIKYTNENIHSRGFKDEFSLGFGLLRSLWGIARQDPRFLQPVRIGIGIDGEPIEAPKSLVLLLISSLERLFLNMHPYWGEDNGKPMHATIIHSPAARLLRNVPSILRGRPNRYMSRDSAYLSYNVDTVSLSFEGPFTLDGEILRADIASGPVQVSSAGELAFMRIQDR